MCFDNKQIQEIKNTRYLGLDIESSFCQGKTILIN